MTLGELAEIAHATTPQPIRSPKLTGQHYAAGPALPNVIVVKAGWLRILNLTILHRRSVAKCMRSLVAGEEQTEEGG